MNVQAVGADVLLVIDDTQILMPRDIAAQIGLALVQVTTATGSVLDDLPEDLVVDLDHPGGHGG